ncbi:MAG TPA: carboxypeptidase regulatory-like domain-containing protein, partial [Terriglobales bacterium]|nr:carboxypeptidase regulatory-like domain-containing protein [Terriglobales bacterium]
WALPLLAQESIQYGSISGQVTDSTGALVKGAQVTARQTETNFTVTSATSNDGRFRLSNLRLGPYEIRIHQDGFADVTRTLSLSVGSAFELPVSLKVATGKESVTVVDEAPVLEAARTQVAGTVPRAEIRSMPLNGRSFLDIALLVPGVSPTNTASTQLFAETSAVPGQGISVSSQRNFSNSFIVDGLSANDDAAGLSGIPYGVDAVQEFQVVTSGGQAEFGRALGGYLNVVTRSGTNSLHGDLYGYFKNKNLNAANALSRTALPLTQTQYGASLGGPLVKDRTFFFSNFEQRLLNQSGLVTITPANVTTINNRLIATGYKGPLITTGLYSNPVHNATFLARVDHQFSSRDVLTVRYSLYDINSRNARGVGALSAATASADLDNLDQAIAVSNVMTFSSSVTNETRGQFTNSNLEAPSSDQIGPNVSIAGVATFGRFSSSPTLRRNKMYEIVDNLSYRRGAHAFRVGINFLYNDDTISNPGSARGSYAFSSMASFLSGTYNNAGYTQSVGNPTVTQQNPNLGFYAQDEWKVGSRLTLNLGLRYDLQYLKTITTDTNNVSPRAGFAWTPFASQRTVVRGSYGLFFDRVPLRAVANALLAAGNTADLNSQNLTRISLSPTQAGAPVFPNVLVSQTLPPGVLINFTTMQRNLQNAYSEQGSLEIEQQLGSNSTVSIGYQHVRGLHLIASINQNVPTCVAAGTNNGCRPNPLYANNSQYSSAADSHYDGLHISFVQRPARWGNYRITYTYSKALNNVGEFFFSSPIDNFNIWRDYGRSDDDQRHRFVFNGSIHSPTGKGTTLWTRLTNGFQLSGMLQYYSALPFNITTGANTVQGTTARPTVNGVFISRNAGTGFDFFNLNTRVSRNFQLTERFRMEGIVEAFNTLNHVNGVSLNGVFGTGAYPSTPSPTFRQVTAVGDPRTIQIALRFGF